MIFQPFPRKSLPTLESSSSTLCSLSEEVVAMPRSTQVDAGRTAAPLLLLALVDSTLGAGSRRFLGASAVGHPRFGLGSGYGELLIRPRMTCLEGNNGSEPSLRVPSQILSFVH